MTENHEREYSRICAVLVTYGDRGEIACRTARGCLDEGLTRVIIVDNGSDAGSVARLKELAGAEPAKVRLIRLGSNTGSAGGFKRGLEEFYSEKDRDYVLLLDDDILPSPGSVRELLSGYLRLKKKDGPLLAVYAERTRRGEEQEINRKIRRGEPISDKDAFLGFNVFRIPGRIFRRIAPAAPAGALPAPVPTAPYGTLFFRKDLIDVIGYPDERMFLYMDDLEYTSRIPARGGEIYMLPSSRMDETTSPSWKQRPLAGGLFMYLEGESELKTYYSARNAVLFESRVLNMAKPNFARSLNKALFLPILFLGALFMGRLPAFRTFIKGIRDGERDLTRNAPERPSGARTAT
jgi:glycosyltransferase involved in cell wall biosynthesis